MNYGTKFLIACLLFFGFSLSLLAQGRVHLRTERDKGSILYLRLYNKSPYMPQLRGLKLLDKWQNDKVLAYEVLEQTMQIDGDFLALYLGNAGLTELNVKGGRHLKELYCAKNKLQNLDLSSNGELEKLDCAVNELSELKLNHNPKLTYLNTYDNKLISLDLSSSKSLRQLYCGANKLKSLSLDEQKSLELLNCASNRLELLKLNPCPKLEEIYCGNNQLRRVSIPINIKPKELFLNQNKLKLISLGSARNLHRLWCFGNKLSKQELEKIVGFLPTYKLDVKGDFRLAQKGEKGLISAEVLADLGTKGWNAIQVSADTWSDLSYYSITQSANLEGFAQDKQVKIYPNPLKGGKLFVQGAKPFILVRLYTMQGQLLLSKRLDSQGALVLDFEQLNLSGYYLLQVGSVSQLLCIEP